MLFNSIEFIILLTITVFIYYLKPFRKFQLQIILISSFIFYGYHSPNLTILFTASILLNTLFSYKIINETITSNRKRYVALGVIFNLSLLVFFKYNKILISLFVKDIGSINHSLKIIYDLPLPIGISFYTFQGISLIVDAYRDRQFFTTNKKIMSFALDVSVYISFFAQLIAGPIVEAKYFLSQINTKYFSDIDWDKTTRYLIWGYFFKVVVADNLKISTDTMVYPSLNTFSSTDLLVLLYAYSIQILADFSGYSAIAIGLGSLFGYNLPENFNLPYISNSFSDFWKRWHISLSSWLRDYLYIPLGGNRKGYFKMLLNLLITMILGGLWHGAAWSYAVWGTYHGLLLVLEKVLQTHIKIKIPEVLKILTIYVLVSIGWLFFKFTNINHVFYYFKAISLNTSIPQDNSMIASVFIYSIPVVFVHLKSYLPSTPYQRSYLKPICYAILLVLILTDFGAQGEFIYFQF